MQRRSMQPKVTGRSRTLLLVVGGFFASCALLGAQEIIEKRIMLAPRAVPGVIGRADAAKEDAAVEKGDALAEEKFPNGASLKTDPELERLLTRADQFSADGRFDLASVLWQKVLDESGDTLMTRDGRTYTSLAAEVERTLAKLPADGLKLYRISADGEANAILATIKQGADEEEALGKVVRRYFMSSLGDDAAYKLGCLALDRHDFVGASRMFQAILDQHPDPSAPRGEILLRLAVASAKVGDAAAATQLLTALDNSSGVRPPRETMTAVKQFVSQADKLSALGIASSRQWHLDYGNASRTGRMQALPKAAAEADLAELWTQDFDVLLPQVINDPRFASRTMRGGAVIMAGPAGGRIISSRSINTQSRTPQETRESLVNRWREEGWFPTGRLLFDGDEKSGRVYVKTATELTAWDTNAQSTEPVWRTAWLNFYEPDGGTQNIIQMGMQGNQIQQDGPRSMAEVLHFGDRVHSSVAISGDLIFNLEGKRVPRSGGSLEPEQRQQQRGFGGYGVVPRRTRRNWLAAYEARTGKARWYRSADDAEKETEAGKTATDIGFLAAPTPYGNLLLAPVTDGGTIWLYALSRTDGKTIWKTYLCDEPQGGASQWSTVGVAIDGRDAYISCGTGAVFAVDAVSGSIRWAVRYERKGTPSRKYANIYGMQNSVLDLIGWQDDLVIPFGKLLVVMPSDSDKIFAVDRRTGEFAWDSPKGNASYCLGVVGRGLFVAGRDSIRKYDIPSGRLVGDRMLNEAPRQVDALAYGRGCLTEDAIYLPVKDSILKLNIDDLSDICQVGVSTVTGDPVGNLFADGDKLWVVGAAKISALTNFDRRMAELAKQIEAGNFDAQLTRMRMQRTRGKVAEAIVDLEGAFKLASAKDRQAAAKIMADGVKELQLGQSQPQTTLRLLQAAFLNENGQPIDFLAGKTTDEDKAAVTDLYSRRAELIYGTLSTIRNKKVPGVAADVLRLAPCFEQEYLVHSARKSLSAAATSDDIPALTAGLESTSPAVVAIAAEALTRVQGESAKPALAKLLESPHEKIKLAGATAVLNLGDRTGLAPLVALLEAADERVASQASAALRNASGKVVAFSPSDAELRKKGVAEWKEWLEKESATAKLTYPLADGEPMLGRTLVCYYAQGKVVEYDENNKERWTANIQGVWGGQGLPNGHRLLALYAMRKIVEYDDKGNEVWSLDNLPGSPFNVRRLPNGNTLVACSDSNRVIEYNRDKKEVSSITTQGRPMDAVRLENGNTLVALSQSGRVVEYAAGDKGELKEVWACDGLVGAMSIERLENGNTLVACMNGGQNGAGMVVEVDTNKNHIWKFDGLRNPYDAQRLPNGNTLITDNQRVQEVDADKKVIWKVEQNGSSSANRF